MGENDRSDASKRRLLWMATADPCGWRAAVLGLRAVRGGALWVWGYSRHVGEAQAALRLARNRSRG